MDDPSTRGPVVVGVSDSPDSDRAVDWAAGWASSTGRPLRIVHAVGSVQVHPNTEDFLDAEQKATEPGRVLVDAAARRVVSTHPNLQTATVVEVGDPPSVLLAQDQNASVLVVGSRRDTTRQLLLGSVSHAVSRHATCPVVVVRELRAETALGRRVVLGIDGTAASRPAAEFAFGYADIGRLPVVIVHASWERLARGSAVLALLSRSDEHGPTGDEELSIAETIAGLPERYPDVAHRDVHRSTDPAAALIEASQSAQLVVVGAHHRNPLTALLLRSVSASVVEHAHCPVAVVRAP